MNGFFKILVHSSFCLSRTWREENRDFSRFYYSPSTVEELHQKSSSRAERMLNLSLSSTQSGYIIQNPKSPFILNPLLSSPPTIKFINPSSRKLSLKCQYSDQQQRPDASSYSQPREGNFSSYFVKWKCYSKCETRFVLFRISIDEQTLRRFSSGIRYTKERLLLQSNLALQSSPL